MPLLPGPFGLSAADARRLGSCHEQAGHHLGSPPVVVTTVLSFPSARWNASSTPAQFLSWAACFVDFQLLLALLEVFFLKCSRSKPREKGLKGLRGSERFKAYGSQRTRCVLTPSHGGQVAVDRVEILLRLLRVTALSV